MLTRFPGASASEVESQVTEPIEELLREVEEIKEVDSTSRFEISVIQVELVDRVSAVDSVWSLVRDKLNDASALLPTAVSDPELDLDSTDVDAYSLILALVWRGSGEAPIGIMGRLVEELDRRLQRVPGTRQTETFGLLPEEVSVEFSDTELSSLGLTTGDLSRLLSGADVRVPSGSYRNRNQNLRLSLEGEFDTLKQIRSLPVLLGSKGQSLFLRDIARVTKGVQTPPGELVLIDGRRGISVSVRVDREDRITAWAGEARKVVEDFRSDLPADLELRILFDQSAYVRGRLDGLVMNLILGGGFVLAVMTLLMGFRSALLVGIDLPLSCLAVFSGLNFLGIPLHQMSVTGLVIALGLLIDNAIIVVGEVRCRLGRGIPAPDAVGGAVRFLAGPLAGSTLTTVLAFAPLFMMPGPAGEFVGPIGISVVLALISSLAISLFIVASLSGWLDRLLPTGGSGAGEAGIRSRFLATRFRRGLEYALSYPLLGLGVPLLLPLAGFVVFLDLEEEFFPAADRREFEVQLSLALTASVEETFELAPNVLPALVLDRFLQKAEGRIGKLPPGYSIEIGGDSQERNEAVNQLLSAASVLLVILVATLVLTFNSFRLALVIMTVGGASLGLSLLSLWIFGFMAIVGSMGLLGVAVNDSIVVLAGIRAKGGTRSPE